VPDTSPLNAAVDRLADRLRALPRSALLRGAAADGYALAAELALRAQRLEFPGRAPRVLPDAGMFAVGDQLAVVGHDLAAALAERGTEEELAEVLALVEGARLTARR
jgi:hypothetical protein